jgi:four helix bundle protein
MTEERFKARTKQVALGVVRLVANLPRGVVPDVIGRQILRSGTSVGANYRAACRSKSALDMLAKLAIVEEEADETLYWLELLIESGSIQQERVADLQREVGEILSMTVASIRTLRARSRQSKIHNPKSKIQDARPS